MASEKNSPPEVVVEGDYQSLTQKISLGPHQLVADEPSAFGGNDRGPSPYELLLASLGACTSITLLMYAKKKGWEVRRVTVWLSHQKIHAQDCQDCETKEGYLDYIQRRIHIDGNLDDEKRERLLQIANRCPVHRTLTSEIKIDTQLTEQA
jgi:uncharacterized OsmC-like protein